MRKLLGFSFCILIISCTKFTKQDDTGFYRPELMKDYESGKSKYRIERVSEPIGINWKKGVDSTLNDLNKSYEYIYWEASFLDGSGLLQRVGVLKDGYVVYRVNKSKDNRYFEFPLSKEGYSTKIVENRLNIFSEINDNYSLLSRSSKESVYFNEHDSINQYIIIKHPILNGIIFTPKEYNRKELLTILQTKYENKTYPITNLEYPCNEDFTYDPDSIKIFDSSDKNSVVYFIYKYYGWTENPDNSHFVIFPKKYEGYKCIGRRYKWNNPIELTLINSNYRLLGRYKNGYMYFNQKNKEFEFLWGVQDK